MLGFRRQANAELIVESAKQEIFTSISATKSVRGSAI